MKHHIQCHTQRNVLTHTCGGPSPPRNCPKPLHLLLLCSCSFPAPKPTLCCQEVERNRDCKEENSSTPRGMWPWHRGLPRKEMPHNKASLKDLTHPQSTPIITTALGSDHRHSHYTDGKTEAPGGWGMRSRPWRNQGTRPQLFGSACLRFAAPAVGMSPTCLPSSYSGARGMSRMASELPEEPHGLWGVREMQPAWGEVWGGC